MAEGQEAALPRPSSVYIERAASGPRSGAAGACASARWSTPNPRTTSSSSSTRVGAGGSAEYLCYHDGEQLRATTWAPSSANCWRGSSAGRGRRGGRDVGGPVAGRGAREVAAPAMPAERMIGEYELLSRLGQGGMGVVYRAWQPSLGRQVALKCMLRGGDPKAEARFAREIRALGQVEHPGW